jgi:sugar/nucleoside kinase (ribokinase family)
MFQRALHRMRVLCCVATRALRCCAAAAAACLCVQRKGAMPSMPLRAEVEALLQQLER